MPKTSLHLERQHLGEAPRREEDGAALEALVEDDAVLLERLAPAMMAARIDDDLRRSTTSTVSTGFPSRPGWTRLAGMLLPAAAAAAILIAVNVNVRSNESNEATPTAIAGDVRLKGKKPALDLLRVGEGGPESLSPGSLVGAGDVVQVQTRAAGARYGVVVSIDGRGGVTRHFPATNTPETPNTALPAGTAPLPFSFELDDAPGFERFFFVTADAPVDVDAVESAALGVTRSPSPMTTSLSALPAAWGQVDFLLRKRPSVTHPTKSAPPAR